MLQHALAHRSWCGEQEGGAPSNERLEFLGDAVLGLIVAGYCYDRYPDFAEGKLAKVRSAVVNARVLAQVARRLRVGEVLLLGKGEEGSGGRTKASILSDAFEAILGAVYLDAGWEDGPRERHLMALPAYDQCIKASHVFYLLDARGVISVTERQSYILRVRELAKACGEAWLKTAGGGTFLPPPERARVGEGVAGR